MMKKYLQILFGLFALVNADNVVQTVIVADQKHVDAHPEKASRWVETSIDKSVTKKYAGKGDEYRNDMAEFIAPKKFDSWVMDAAKAEYVAPTPMVDSKKAQSWNEAQKKWEVNLDAETRKARAEIIGSPVKAAEPKPVDAGGVSAKRR